MREADERQLAEWTEKVAQAKARLGLADEISCIFEAMQNRAHSRSVGSFERLLSAVLQDVLPGKGNIRLELSSSANAPNLDIYVDNGGSLEDVLEGSGGAVTNVISAGLRFAALTRTKNRRLMVLDEPDCWIKPSRVPNFIRVISEVAASTGTQTLLISHHDPAYFRGRVNLIELTRNETGQVCAVAGEPALAKWQSAEQPGIRSIRLVNFRAHEDTTLQLAPGVTALIGDNDLGKSTALVASLKAVGYNESDDTVIRHGCKHAQVVIELEGGKRLVWTRKAKGSPKVVYALYRDAELVAEGKAPGRGSVPDWVTAELGISEVDDLDIQVGSQKNPVFLLDQPASRRAQLLSVGRESGHLSRIMELWGDIKRADRDVVRDGELRITRLAHRLAQLSSVTAIGELTDTLFGQFSQVDATVSKSAQLSRLIAVQQEAGLAVARLSQETAVLQGVPGSLPDLADTAKLGLLTVRIQRGEPFRKLALPEIDAPVPELRDTSRLTRTGSRLAQLQKYRAVFGAELPTIPELPPLADHRMLKACTERLVLLHETVTRSLQDHVRSSADVEREQAALRKLHDDLGGVCPLCDNKFDDEHEHATAH